MAGIRLSAIAFRPVVRLAQHLTVRHIRSAAATPCGHMVGVHLGFLVNAFRVRIMWLQSVHWFDRSLDKRHIFIGEAITLI